MRYQASLKHKLFRRTFCNLFFTRFRQNDTEFSGPATTEPGIGDYKPLTTDWNEPDYTLPREADIAIVGGGLAGLFSAFFIKHRFPRGFNIVVVEKDPLVRLQHHICTGFNLLIFIKQKGIITAHLLRRLFIGVLCIVSLLHIVQIKLKDRFTVHCYALQNCEVTTWYLKQAKEAKAVTFNSFVKVHTLFYKEGSF